MDSSERKGQEATLRQKLEACGGHLTRQRATVFDYVRESRHHPTTEEIYMAVKRKLPRISLATVYKNLEALVACGAVSKMSYGDSAARYDIRTDQHYHTHCLGCGEIWDLDAEQGAELLKQIKPQAGFAVKDYRLELLGYCSKCRR